MASEAKEDHRSELVVDVTTPNGRTARLSQWHTVSFNRSVGGVVGTMTLTCAYNPRVPWRQLVERPCVATLVFDAVTGSAIHSMPMVTGYIKGLKVTHKAEGGTVTITVRDKTVDLEECNPVITIPSLSNPDGVPSTPAPEWLIPPDPRLTPPSFTGETATLFNICKKLSAPVGITVTAEGQWVQEVRDGVVNVSEEESIFNQIANLCKEQAVIPHTDGYGRLVLGQFAYYSRLPAPYSSNPYDVEINRTVQLYYEQESVLSNPGESWNEINESDVLAVEHVADFTDRFSDYKVIYNPSGDAGDEATTETSRWSKDPKYRGRFRPKVVRPTIDYKGSQQKFADFIRQTQRGSSNTIKVELRYWYKVHLNYYGHREAKIYDIGDTVNLKLSKWGYVGQMVIDAVDYSLSGASHRKLTLTLKALDTYAPPPQDNVYYDWLDGVGDDGAGNATGSQNYDYLIATMESQENAWGNRGSQDAAEANLPKWSQPLFNAADDYADVNLPRRQ